MPETFLSIAGASVLLRRKQLSPVELTTSCLSRIEQLNPALNAFITVLEESALAQARAAEAEIFAGEWRGPLHGIPIGLKDLIDTAGVRTTCGSALFADRVPTEDAEVVRRLKNAGAILIGKQNMQEFAWGGTSASSYFGPVKNAWDNERIAGGSSGGSAAAVAAGMCFGAIGTDTGGSVRQPAAFCGIVGLKPTYGLVSTAGVFPLSPSLDHVGPLCRNVADTALLLQAIADYEKLELLETKPRIGVVRRPFFDGIDPEIGTAFDGASKTCARCLPMSSTSNCRTRQAQFRGRKSTRCIRSTSPKHRNFTDVGCGNGYNRRRRSAKPLTSRHGRNSIGCGVLQERCFRESISS